MSFCSRKDVTNRPKVGVVQARAMTTANNDAHFELTAGRRTRSGLAALLAGLQFWPPPSSTASLATDSGTGAGVAVLIRFLLIWITLNTMIGMRPTRR